MVQNGQTINQRNGNWKFEISTMLMNAIKCNNDATELENKITEDESDAMLGKLIGSFGRGMQ